MTQGKGNFEKLRIESYKDSAFTEKVEGIFMLLLILRHITTRHKIEFCDTQAPGRSMPVLKFNKIPAQK
ncbi:MAG: hypothetical protein IPL53_19050 [Ignavibacteria bacterium]|nr:hypothetical protein [Ignavibacteria bacterium]